MSRGSLLKCTVFKGTQQKILMTSREKQKQIPSYKGEKKFLKYAPVHCEHSSCIQVDFSRLFLSLPIIFFYAFPTSKKVSKISNRRIFIKTFIVSIKYPIFHGIFWYFFFWKVFSRSDTEGRHEIFKPDSNQLRCQLWQAHQIPSGVQGRPTISEKRKVQRIQEKARHWNNRKALSSLCKLHL